MWLAGLDSFLYLRLVNLIEESLWAQQPSPEHLGPIAQMGYIYFRGLGKIWDSPGDLWWSVALRSPDFPGLVSVGWPSFALPAVLWGPGGWGGMRVFPQCSKGLHLLVP